MGWRCAVRSGDAISLRAKKFPANSLPDFTGYLATIEDSWCDKNSLAADV
jgi:hypothetical protein